MTHILQRMYHLEVLSKGSNESCGRSGKNGGTVPDFRLFWRAGFFPYISRIHTAYTGE